MKLGDLIDRYNSALDHVPSVGPLNMRIYRIAVADGCCGRLRVA